MQIIQNKEKNKVATTKEEKEEDGGKWTKKQRPRPPISIEGPVAESQDVSSTHRIMFYKSSPYPGTHFIQKPFLQIYLEEDQPDKNGNVSTRLCMRQETAL